jgi:hypothetical protein
MAPMESERRCYIGRLRRRFWRSNRNSRVLKSRVMPAPCYYVLTIPTLALSDLGLLRKCTMPLPKVGDQAKVKRRCDELSRDLVQ